MTRQEKIKQIEEESDLTREYFNYEEKKEVWRCVFCKKPYKMLGDHLYNHAKAHLDAGEYPPQLADVAKEMEKREEQVVEEKVEKTGSKINFTQRNLQAKIIERMIKDGSLNVSTEEFEKLYADHRSGRTGANRFAPLKVKIERRELEMIEAYLYEGEVLTSIKELADQFGIAGGSLYSHVVRIALKIVYQHKEILKEVKKEVNG